MEQHNPGRLTLREYARQQGITLQTAYRRIWDGKVSAERFDGRWLVFSDGQPTQAASEVR